MMVETYKCFSQLTQHLTQMKPCALDPERASSCLYNVYSPLMEQYIEREIRSLREMYDREIRRWERQMEEMRQRARNERLLDAAEREAYKRGLLRRLKQSLRRNKETNERNPTTTDTSLQYLSGLLSLEMSLQMIQVNKQSLHRVLRFASLGGRAGIDVQVFNSVHF
jgi:hypothetical protein